MLLRLLSRTTWRISFHPLVLGIAFAYFFFDELRNILLQSAQFLQHPRSPSGPLYLFNSELLHGFQRNLYRLLLHFFRLS